VKVLSLGKPAQGWSALGRGGHLNKLLAVVNFYKYIWQELQNYDTVFVHMNQIYLLLAGGWWRLMGKKVGFWYTHKQVNWQLWAAEKFASVIFTASPESFRLVSKKAMVVGHGIDVERFICPTTTPNHDGPLHIISVGRITRIKDLQTLIKAAAILKNKITRPLRIDLIGGAVMADDRQYQAELERLVTELGLGEEVRFVGPVKPDQLPARYCGADLSVNLCPTGGMDKAVLESLAAGRPALVANETFRAYFGPELSNQLIFAFGQPEDLAGQIEKILDSDQVKLGEKLVMLVRRKSGLSAMITRIINELR
jgi:glycosyltransferase involved in cell wall biosynthesis